MSDSLLLLTGIAVFSLMLIGVFLTAMEYKRLEKNSRLSNSDNSHSSTSRAQKTGAGSEGD
jgi:hypothetical protein